MDQYEYIRIAHRVYGKSIRQIAKDTGHSRNTVKKALHQEFPSYKTRSPLYPVLQPFLHTIDHWLLLDLSSPKKQRHTARRIFHRLVHEFQFQGSESAVKKYVKLAKIRLLLHSPQAFIPLLHSPAKSAEIDWGKADAFLNDQQVSLHYFCFRSTYSGKPFLRFYFHETQQAFFDAHLHAFHFFGGVFPTLIYDNLKSAVRLVLKGKRRIEQENFQKFKAYYTFEAQFCNLGKGHEKGGVEGMIGFGRRNFMVPLPRASTLEELNQKLLQDCISYGKTHRLQGQEKTVDEKFDEEKEHLLSNPLIPFTNVILCGAKVDKFSTIWFESNRYSLPIHYVGVQVEILSFMERIEIYFEGKLLVKHQRSFKKGEWVLDWLHYIDLVKKRPGSFKEARPIHQFKKLWPASMNEMLEKCCQKYGESKGIKEFIEILMLFKENEESEVYSAIELATQNNISCCEGVKQLLEYTGESSTKSVPLKNWEVFEAPSLEPYADLGKVE